MLTKVVLAILTISPTFSKALVFDCVYSNISWWITGEKYTCMPKVVMSGSPDTLEGVTSNHLTGKNNNDVLGLYVYNQFLQIIPKDIEKFFPNLNSLSFDNNQLKELSSSDLKTFPNLYNFHVQYNDLDSLPGDLFKYSPKLEVALFRGNKLRHIGVNLLSHLTTLSIASFVGNPCIDIEVINNTKAMVDLLYKISVYCPPTFEMFEVSLLSSQNFQRNIDARTDNKLKPLNSTMHNLLAFEAKERQIAVENVHQQIDDLSREIAELRKEIRELSPCVPS